MVSHNLQENPHKVCPFFDTFTRPAYMVSLQAGRANIARISVEEGTEIEVSMANAKKVMRKVDAVFCIWLNW